MNDHNFKTRIICVFIVVLVLFMGLSTIAFIKYNKKENDSGIVDNNLKVTFDSTSNIALVNAKKGDKITKTFTVKNISNDTIYYEILFDNLINNYKDEGDITFSLNGSKNSAYVDKNNMLKNSGVVASNIKLNKNEEHNYNLDITVINSDEINKTFSTDILVKTIDTKDIYSSGSLGYKIINDNKVNFDEKEGLFYTNNSIDGKTVYYFKGSRELNNNVLLDNLCFRIIRTTEDNGIRLIYNGESHDGVCDGVDNIIDTSEYNAKSNYNAYVGYLYGTPNSTTYIKEHENINSSKIKSTLDSYFVNNLNKYSSIIKNSTYCNNRKTERFTYNKVLYGTNGYKNDNTGYESMYRLIKESPSYKCDYDNDKISSQIGLITAEEAFYAGITDKEISDNYLNSDNAYWTMSPAYFNGVGAYNYIVKSNDLWQNNVSEKSGIRPVITINGNTKVKSGNGKMDNPYVIY